MTAPILEVEALSLRAGGRTVVEAVGFVLAAGQHLAVIGPNGAGKSTLIHALIGDLAPAAGAIRLSGRTLADWPARERACRVALLPQASALNFPFTVAEVVRLGRGPHASGSVADRRIVGQTLAACDIAHLRDRPYTRLSGGEKQRVQLARVMSQIWRAEDAGERLLLLDEPVAALDLGHQRLVMQQVAELAAQGVAIVSVLHDISLAARYADRMLALRDGRTIAAGTPAEVVTAERMQCLFDTHTRVITHPDSHTPVVLHG
ncbi:hemin importer ATP-binding subunit [Salinisphaera sp. S4-8]|uniref:heme ABC transporter ATP-binding protein n=1 Tax=Salinisphaera sp. S4-8 TaxID=633357 RepID=UPI0033420B3C